MNNFKQKKVMSTQLFYKDGGEISINQWSKVVKRIDHLKQNINSLIKCKYKYRSKTCRQSSIQVKKSCFKESKSKSKKKLTQRYCSCCKETRKQQNYNKNRTRSLKLNNSCKICSSNVRLETKNISEVVSPIRIRQNPLIFYSKQNQNKVDNFQQLQKKLNTQSHLNEQQTIFLNYTCKKKNSQNNKNKFQPQTQAQLNNSHPQQSYQDSNNYNKNQTFVNFDQLKRLQALNHGLQMQNKLLQKKLLQQIKYRKIAQTKLIFTEDFIKYNQKIKNKTKNIKVDPSKDKQACTFIKVKKKDDYITPKASQQKKQKNINMNISTVKKICQKTKCFLQEEIQPYINDLNLTMRCNDQIKNKKIKSGFPQFKTQETDSLHNYTDVQDQLFPKILKPEFIKKKKRLNQSYQPFSSSQTNSLNKRSKTLDLNLKKSCENYANQQILMEEQLLLSPQFKKQLDQSGKQQEIAYLQQQFQELLGQIRNQNDIQKKKIIRKKMGIVAESIKQLKSSLKK